ncbi:MAG: hypothetical protein RI988_4118 [Pseudomonadota bacterium]|jgi:hypothetical protein
MSATLHKLPASQLSLGLERPDPASRQPVRPQPDRLGPRGHVATPGLRPGSPGDGAESDSATLHAFEATGCAIGRDYARHGLMPPPDHLHAGHPVRAGWEAAWQRLARPGQRLQPAGRHVQLWLELRLSAWLRGQAFDVLQVTPRWLARIDTPRCPVTREVLTHGHGASTDAVVVALRRDEGYVPGNLVVLSRGAADALAQEAALHALAGRDAHAALRARGLLALALATPMPHAGASVEPLALMPPVRVHVRNPAHALQALVGTLFQGGGYARRMSDLGALVPGGPARRAYALLMSALLARRLDAGWAAAPHGVRETLEDAWLHPMVLRHWQALMRSLTPVQCERIVRTALARGLAAGRARLAHTWPDGACPAVPPRERERRPARPH